MRIQFCGADRTVTGSCHLVETQGLRVLLDCGMFQGPRDEANDFNHWIPTDVKTIDAIILSHGHLDHCGKLPALTRAGYTGPIYCTPATAEVARIVLEDSAKIQEENAQYLNNRARDPNEPKVEPLYSHKDVHDVLKLFRRVQYGTKTRIDRHAGFSPHGTSTDKDMPAKAGTPVRPSFTFFDAGHI